MLVEEEADHETIQSSGRCLGDVSFPSVAVPLHPPAGVSWQLFSYLPAESYHLSPLSNDLREFPYVGIGQLHSAQISHFHWLFANFVADFH